MPKSSRKSSGYAVLTVSMCLLVTGLGIGGGLGILLNLAAIAGCVVAIVLLAGSDKPGQGAGTPTG